ALGELRLGPGQPRLGLGDVGAGDLADIEAGAGFVELALENADVLLADAQGLDVAAGVDIGGDDIGQDLGLDPAQVLAAGQDVGVGRGGRRGDTAAGVERLRKRESGRAGAVLDRSEDLHAADAVAARRAGLAVI